MTPKQWERAKDIFDAALELPPDARPGYLETTCGSDTIVLAEVRQLLLANGAVHSSFLQPNWIGRTEPDISLRPGELVSGRFRIIRPLGDGGMGRVYEAHDSTLGVAVALKTLRPEIATNPAILTRFHQEVRIAHRITHPNVCRTFHLDRELGHITSDGSGSVDLTFITMELLDGETLQQLLKRVGRLEPTRALAIATQIAGALDAAHRIGVIHRDIKPGNVMICPARQADSTPDRVVITDFGLAKLDIGSPANPDFSSISQPGQTLGTLAYMAPEQLSGSPITPATDIYAFGLVLFEMVTGAKAFADSHTLSAAYQRTVSHAPSARSLCPDVPVAWSHAIAECLSIDPLSRPKSAGDFISLLYPGGRRPMLRIPKPLYGRAEHAKKLTRKAIILACIMSALVAGFRLYSLRQDTNAESGALVYLAPVKNETGDPRLDNITELVQASLEQSSHINLLAPARASDLLRDMRRPESTLIDESTAREIAMRAGAVRVIFATIKGGPAFFLSVAIQQPDNSPSRFRKLHTERWHWEQNVESNGVISPELLGALREASGWIRHEVGESSNDIARLDVPPEDVTTGKWQALMEYTHASKLAAAGKSEDAVLAFQNAIASDPEFALAYARKGDLLRSMNRSTESYDAYSHALEAGLDHRLTRKERDFIKGSYANDTGDYVAGEAAFRDYAAFYENDYLGIFFRAYPLRMLGKFREAVRTLDRARELSPASGGPYMGLAYNYMLLRDFNSARAQIVALEKLGRRDSAAMLAGHLAFLEERPASAAESFALLDKSQAPEQRSTGYALRARLAAEYGDLDAATRELNAGIESDELRGDKETAASKLLDRAFLECVSRESYSACYTDARSALDLSSRPDNLLRASIILGTAIGKARIPAAIRAALKNQLGTLPSRLPAQDYGLLFQIARLRLQGEIQLANGEWEKAVVTFRTAATLEPPITDREYLARALLAQASHSTSSADAQSLREEALALREQLVTHPQLIWNYSPSYSPGFLAAQMKNYLQLSSLLHRKGQTLQNIRSAYSKLRPHDPTLAL